MNLEQTLIYKYLKNAGYEAKLIVADIMVAKGIQKWSIENDKKYQRLINIALSN